MQRINSSLLNTYSLDNLLLVPLVYPSLSILFTNMVMGGMHIAYYTAWHMIFFIIGCVPNIKQTPMWTFHPFVRTLILPPSNIKIVNFNNKIRSICSKLNLDILIPWQHSSNHTCKSNVECNFSNVSSKSIVFVLLFLGRRHPTTTLSKHQNHMNNFKFSVCSQLLGK